MVSTRPSPNPARGRFAYPSAANYTPGDIDNSPIYHGVGGESGSPSAPLVPVTSSGSERERNVQGLKSWWKGFSQQQQQQSSSSSFQGKTAATSASGALADSRRVFGVPLVESLEYASVQVSTAGPNGSLYVWG